MSQGKPRQLTPQSTAKTHDHRKLKLDQQRSHSKLRRDLTPLVAVHHCPDLLLSWRGGWSAVQPHSKPCIISAHLLGFPVIGVRLYPRVDRSATRSPATWQHHTRVSRCLLDNHAASQCRPATEPLAALTQNSCQSVDCAVVYCAVQGQIEQRLDDGTGGARWLKGHEIHEPALPRV